jgi:hypothetical protein
MNEQSGIYVRRTPPRPVFMNRRASGSTESCSAAFCLSGYNSFCIYDLDLTEYDEIKRTHYSILELCIESIQTRLVEERRIHRSERHGVYQLFNDVATNSHTVRNTSMLRNDNMVGLSMN